MNQNSTKQHITLAKNFLKSEVRTILDIQCGGGYDIENCIALQDKYIKYIGVDVVDEIIQDNRQYFRYDKNKIFMILDASNEPLPQSDLVICSGMMEYLPISNIWSLLENIRDSNAKYVIFDYYHSKINELAINEDIIIESVNDLKNNNPKSEKKKEPTKRAINLTKAPFYFPKPQILIPSDDINHSIALYEIKDIKFFMDWHNDDISYLRSKLFFYLEEDYKNIKEAFIKESYGEELLKDIVFSESLDWNKMFYDEKCKKIMDNNGIFTLWIDFLLLLFASDLKRLLSDRPERYEGLITEENFLWASVIAKDYIKWKYKQLFC